MRGKKRIESFSIFTPPALVLTLYRGISPDLLVLNLTLYSPVRKKCIIFTYYRFLTCMCQDTQRAFIPSQSQTQNQMLIDQKILSRLFPN